MTAKCQVANWLMDSSGIGRKGQGKKHKCGTHLIKNWHHAKIIGKSMKNATSLIILLIIINFGRFYDNGYIKIIYIISLLDNSNLKLFSPIFFIYIKFTICRNYLGTLKVNSTTLCFVRFPLIFWILNTEIYNSEVHKSKPKSLKI